MDKKIKVILTQRWWETNRAKTLTDKGNLGKALKEFEGAFSLALVAKGLEKFDRLSQAEKACKALRLAAAATAAACVAGVHGDTQWVLKNSFLKAVEEQEKTLEKVREKFEAEINALTLENLFENMSLRPLLFKFAEKAFVGESVAFLAIVGSGGRGDEAAFKAFIKEGAPKQVNISNGARTSLEEAHRNGTLANSPHWKTAVIEVTKLLKSNNLVTNFKQALIKRAI